MAQTWEEKMSDRAAKRRAEERAEFEKERAAAVEAMRCTVDEYLSRIDMTVEEAQELRSLPSIACSCAGPPEELRGGDGKYPAPCFCAITWMKVEQLLGPLSPN
jgi:hypothetical protein